MIREMLLLLFALHLIGDFYLQSKDIADRKEKEFKGTLFHGLFYCIPFLLYFIAGRFSVHLAISFLIICLVHFMIDTIKFFYNNKIRKNRKKNSLIYKEAFVYVVDQALHIVTIMVVCIVNNTTDISLWTWIHRIFDLFNMNYKWLQCGVLLLLIYKPLNITHGKLFSLYKPVNMQGEVPGVEKDRENRAGALIGFMERLIIVIFLYLQQYAAIGLVLTAKSIVRYDRISKEQSFSEYYLIGTLYSLIAALISYYLILH